MLVYVVGHDGRPLMPTSNGAFVRIALKDGRAKVIKGKPFTIKLLYETISFAMERRRAPHIALLCKGSARQGNDQYSKGKARCGWDACGKGTAWKFSDWLGSGRFAQQRQRIEERGSKMQRHCAD